MNVNFKARFAKDLQKIANTNILNQIQIQSWSYSPIVIKVLGCLMMSKPIAYAPYKSG